MANALAPPVQNRLLDTALSSFLNWMQSPQRTQQAQGIGRAIQSALENIPAKDAQYQALQRQAFGDPRNPLKVTDPNALAAMTDMMMAGPLGFAPAGLTVWHGSPHRFDKFDSSKIGTGEGAQAYGHGHYTAEAKDVAGSYAVNLANRDMANQGRLNAHANAQRLVNLTGNPKYAADDLKFVLESQPDHPQKKLLTDTLQMLESGDYAKPLKTTGSLYKIDLPDEQIAKMLDWDKPLSQQPNVKAAMEAIKKDIALPKMQDAEGAGFAYQHLANAVGGQENAAALLRQQGIPGIRYLDQGSRGGGQGTSNFVIFPGNEGLLTILERNGTQFKK